MNQLNVSKNPQNLETNTYQRQRISFPHEFNEFNLYSEHLLTILYDYDRLMNLGDLTKHFSQSMALLSVGNVDENFIRFKRGVETLQYRHRQVG